MKKLFLVGISLIVLLAVSKGYMLLFILLVLLTIQTITTIRSIPILYKKYKKEHKLFDFIMYSFLSTTPIFSQVMLMSMLDDRRLEISRLDEKYNEIYLCKSCELLTRKGHIDLYQTETGNKKCCPNCDSYGTLQASKKNINTNLPLAPKFSKKQLLDLDGTLGKIRYEKLIEKQMEAYMKLQRNKLDKMREETLDKLDIQ